MGEKQVSNDQERLPSRDDRAMRVESFQDFRNPKILRRSFGALSTTRDKQSIVDDKLFGDRSRVCHMFVLLLKIQMKRKDNEPLVGISK